MSRRIVLISVASLLCAVPSAGAHASATQHKHIAPPAAESPGCDAPLSERRDWAAKTTVATTKRGQKDYVIRTWINTRLCAGEDVTMNGTLIKAPKEPGDPVPMLLDPGTVEMPYDPASPNAEPGTVDPNTLRKQRKPKRPLARNHGSCSVGSNIPFLSGAYMYFSGQITCTNATGLDGYLEAHRRYLSTLNIVLHASWSHGSVWATQIYMERAAKCPPSSEYRSSFFGRRTHDDYWGPWVQTYSDWRRTALSCQ